MKKLSSLFVGLLLLASQSANANSNVVLSCWDGTFAYNNASVVRADDGGLEVTMTGSSIGVVEFGSNDLIINDWDFPSKKVHIKFPASACPQASDELVECSLESQERTRDVAIFVEQDLRHLNTSRKVITGFNVESVQFVLGSAQKGELIINGARFLGQGQADTQTLSFDLSQGANYCQDNAIVGPGYEFPQELRDFLSDN